MAGIAAGARATAARLNAMGQLVAPPLTWIADSTTWTTTAVMLKTQTVPALANVYYQVIVDSGWSITAAGTTTFKIHAAGGASVSTSDAFKYARKWRAHEGGAFDDMVAISQPFTITPSGGQMTVGLAALADAGTGRLEADNDNIGWMAVFAVGLV